MPTDLDRSAIRDSWGVVFQDVDRFRHIHCAPLMRRKGMYAELLSLLVVRFVDSRSDSAP